MASPTLSPDGRRAQQALASDLRRIFGNRLLSLCAYGLAAPDGAGIHSIALVDRLDFDDLAACAPLAARWDAEPTEVSAPRLRIGLIAPPWVAVPPPEYGGTELVIDQLARELTAAGHEVVLCTTGDSTCPVERHWTLPAAVGTTGFWITVFSVSNSALRMVTQAPATVAWPAV